MNYRKLGNTGVRVSQIGLGCSGFWGDRHFPEESAGRVLSLALEQGVNLFDTGHNYSAFHADPRLGNLLKRQGALAQRERLVLSTKAGTLLARAPVLGRANTVSQDFSADAIEASCIASLRNLHCDYIDIFQLHGIAPHQITDELLTRLASMRGRGLFRWLGINTHSADTMRYISRNPGLFDVALIDYNLLQTDREPLIADMHASGIGILAGTVLAQGHLLPGRLNRLRSPADLWYLLRAWLKSSRRELRAASPQMRAAMRELSSLSPPQACFAYILRNPHISSGILGTTRPASLGEVLATNPDGLSLADLELITSALQHQRHSPSH